MISLSQVARQLYEETKRQRERERNEQPPTEPLVPSQRQQSSNERSSSTNTEVNIVQPNQPINEESRNVRLGNVIQSNEFQNVQQPAPAGNENKININAALLSFLLYACSISLIVYGSIHINDCPAEKMITITFIVMGCLMLVSRLLSSPEEVRNIFKNESNPQFYPQALFRMCLNLITQIVTMCFFFALCYWIFHINPDFKEGSPNFCEKELYKNTKYGVIAALSILGIGFVIICCGLCVCCVALCRS